MTRKNEKIYFDPLTWCEYLPVLTRKQESYYSVVTKSDEPFTERPTGSLALSQVLKSPREQKIWYSTSGNHSGKSVSRPKKLIFCAWTCLFYDIKRYQKRFNETFSNLKAAGFEIFYWQGDAHDFGSFASFSSKTFIPAQAETVRKKIETERFAEAHQFLIIDQEEMLQWLSNQHDINPLYLGGWGDLKKIKHELDYISKSVKILPTMQLSADRYEKIVVGMSNKITLLEFDTYSSDGLTPETIIKHLPRFPNLTTLSLENMVFSEDELDHVAKECPYISNLQMAFNTLPPALSKFNHLQYLRMNQIYTGPVDTDVNFFAKYKQRNIIRELHFYYSRYLINISAIRFCENLESLYLSAYHFEDFADFLASLEELHQLRSLSLSTCTYGGLQDSEIVELVIKSRINRSVKLDTAEGTFTIERLQEKCASERLDTGDYYFVNPDDVGVEKKSATKSASLYSILNYDDRKPVQCKVQQVFWHSDDSWPDYSLDRWSIITTIAINEAGRIIFTPASEKDLELQTVDDIKYYPRAAINTALLRDYEKKLCEPKQHTYCYAGELSIQVSNQYWTKIPTRGVSNRPLAMSEEERLICAYSKVTGELFLRLPESSIRRKKTVLLRYAVSGADQTLLRRIKLTPLPATLHSAFTALISNSVMRKKFPCFDRLIKNIKKDIDNDKKILTHIQAYCQFATDDGFSDNELDEKSTKAITDFVKSLPNLTQQTAADLTIVLNVLLQQKGVCRHATRSFKWLCDYYELLCHYVESKVHEYPEYAYIKSAGQKTQSINLGGAGEMKIDAVPLHQAGSKISVIDDKITLSKSIDINRQITAIVDKLEPVFANGADCKTTQEYVKQVLACKTPLIYLQKSADAFAFLLGLMKYIDSHPSYSRQRFLYVDHPAQLSNQLEAVCIENNNTSVVKGLLGKLLDDECPSILVINFSEFSPLDLLETQGIGDKNRTLKTYSSLKNTLHFIGLIEIACLSKQDSFLSRSIPFENREDLFPKAEDMGYGMSASLDETCKTAIVQHLYHNNTQAETMLVGGAELIDGEFKYVEGALPKTMTTGTSLRLTDIPATALSLLRNINLTQQVLVNGQLCRLPKGFQWSHQKRLAPHSDIIQFVDTPQGKRPFYLNPDTYNLLVTGDATIDPKTGQIKSRLARLLSIDDRPDIIILTQSLSYSNWCRLVDEINGTKQMTSICLSFGVKIAGTKHHNSSVSLPASICTTEEKWLEGNMAIETNDLESAIKFVMKQLDLSAGDVLTLTPQINLELLMLIERKEGCIFSYRDGWLLARLRQKNTITVIAGFMSETLYYRLESLFTKESYLYTHEGRESFPGTLIWIKPQVDPIILSSVVRKRRYSASQNYIESKPLLAASLKENVNSLIDFLLQPVPRIVELVGPAGSGKTLSIQQASDIIKKQGYVVRKFFTIEEYVESKKEEKTKKLEKEKKQLQASKIIALLQLNDAALLPAGSLEGLRDVMRRKESFWNGEWYPAPKVIFTNSLETKALRIQHGIFSDPQWPMPQLMYAPLTEKELSSQILEPLLRPSFSIHHKKITAIILTAYRYMSSHHPSLSTHELMRVCQRLQVLYHSVKTTRIQTILIAVARVCYKEFFGLLSAHSQRADFWQHLLSEIRKSEPYLKETAIGAPININLYLKNKLQATDLEITEQHHTLAEMIWRQLEIHQHTNKDFVANCRLLLEGPPGVLKTELILAILNEYGYQEASNDESKLNEKCYINLTVGDPNILQKQVQQAYAKHWVIVCNEINLLPLSVQSALSNRVDAGLSLLATQNATTEGGGRQPLSPRLKNRLQIIHVWDYTVQDWQRFAKNYGFRESELIAAMFVHLKEYQHQYQLPIANARHYFRFLKNLRRQDSSPNLILQHLFKDCCNPPLVAIKESKPGQHDAAHFILQRVHELLPIMIEEKSLIPHRPDIFSEARRSIRYDTADDDFTQNYCLVS